MDERERTLTEGAVGLNGSSHKTEDPSYGTRGVAASGAGSPSWMERMKVMEAGESSPVPRPLPPPVKTHEAQFEFAEVDSGTKPGDSPARMRGTAFPPSTRRVRPSRRPSSETAARRISSGGIRGSVGR
jgi:hypothetical protein